MPTDEATAGPENAEARDVLSRWEGARWARLRRRSYWEWASERFGAGYGGSRRRARRASLDRRLGRCSGRAVPHADAAEVERLYRARYWGFTAKHFHEHLNSSATLTGHSQEPATGTTATSRRLSISLPVYCHELTQERTSRRAAKARPPQRMTSTL